MKPLLGAVLCFVLVGTATASAVSLKDKLRFADAATDAVLGPGLAVPAPEPLARVLQAAVDERAEEAGDGAFWLRLDLEARTATWLRAPYDPRPARERAGYPTSMLRPATR